MGTRRGTFPLRSRSRRISDWGVGPVARDVSFVANAKVLWTLGTQPSQSLTLVRTRGLVSVTLTAGNAAGAGFFGAHGICMVSPEAFAARPSRRATTGPASNTS